jgi:hypothetical protein
MTAGTTLCELLTAKRGGDVNSSTTKRGGDVSGEHGEMEALGRPTSLREPSVSLLDPGASGVPGCATTSTDTRNNPTITNIRFILVVEK